MPYDTDARTRVAALVRVEEAMVRAYDEALDWLGENKAAPTLRRFRGNHATHVESLCKLGEKIGAEHSLARIIDEYFDTVEDAVGEVHGFRAVLSTLRIAEATVKLQYDDVLRSHPPEDVAAALFRCLQDEDEHLIYLKRLSHEPARV